MLKVSLIAYTPDPDKLVSAAAKLCYSPVGVDEILEDLTDENVNKFLGMLVDMGHESPLEHVSFTFGVEGLSRVSEVQLVRHRIGCSYSIQSGRYVRRDGAEFIIPPSIQANEEALKVFLDTIDVCSKAYSTIADILAKEHYDKLIAADPLFRTKDVFGDPLDLIKEQDRRRKKYKSEAEKKAIEDARYIHPQSLGTKLVFTMNARALLNFFNHRCCNRAQWEIRQLAYVMLMELKKIAPVLFKNAGPACLYGTCPEGKMSCGKTKEMRELYKVGD